MCFTGLTALSHHSTNDDCRLYYSTVVVRMCALPLVCDSPLDLKEELSCSLQRVASIARRQSASAVTADDVELLLRCAVLHSVLLQRQTCRYEGRIYSW